jgi:acetyl-CoA decarbonylase/synthase complex subunit delta
VGQESWRAKEAKSAGEQGIVWETVTAASFIQSGADLLVLRHPAAAKKISDYINELFVNKDKGQGG